MSKIMGPNPIKLTEELLKDCKILPGQKVCDLGSGMGLTSVFMAKEYGFTVYASDLWSDPAENAEFFRRQGLDGNRRIPVKADAENMPFEREFFDALDNEYAVGDRAAINAGACKYLNFIRIVLRKR